MPLIRKDSVDPLRASPNSQENLIAGLRHASADERWRAARALAGAVEAAPALSAALAGETDPRVREAIFTSLITLPQGEGAEAVAPYLRSDDANLRAGALDALRTLGPAVGTVLPSLLRDADPDVRGFACDLARQLAAADAVAVLCEVLERDPAPNVCAAAVDVLAELGEPSATPALTRCAARFADQRFLGFAIRVALDRIAASA